MKSMFRKPGEQKYFTLEDYDAGAAWNVTRGRYGYSLSGVEIGVVADGFSTVCDALNAQGGIIGGHSVETNVDLDELLEIMDSRALENIDLCSLTVNGVGMDVESFEELLGWYREVCAKKASSATPERS